MFGFNPKAMDINTDILENLNSDIATSIPGESAANDHASSPNDFASNEDDEAFVVDVSDVLPSEEEDHESYRELDLKEEKTLRRGETLEHVTFNDPLDTSLHTICSQASIELADLVQAMEKKGDNNGEIDESLSLHPSQVNSSDLKEINDETFTVAKDQASEANQVKSDQDQPSLNETTPDLDTMISINQPLLKSGEQETLKPENGTTAPSFLIRHKFLVFLAIFLGAAVRGINNRLSAPAPAKTSLPPMTTEPTKIVIHEDESTLHVGNVSYRKETLEPSSLSFSSIGIGQVLLFGMIAKVALSQKKNNNNTENADSSSSSNDNDSQAGSDASSVEPCSDEPDTDTSVSKKDSVPILIPIKIEFVDSVVAAYDLSKYEKLKVVELRALLRSRQCNYVGRKTKLIQRLASVYRAELQSMTVVQLRRKLKSRKMKQGSRKHELVQMLVEAGL